MAIYLIDYENIKNLTGISRLSADDTAVIFYSKNANTMTFDTHNELVSSKAKIEYKFVSVGGKNALDFQLSTYLGYLINTVKSKTEFCIISRDNGFSYLISFWKKEKNIDINLFTDLTGKTQHNEVEESKSTIRSALKQSSLTLNEKEINEILRIISQYKTKQAINSNMMKYFRDSEKVGAITKVIKPFIKDKK